MRRPLLAVLLVGTRGGCGGPSALEASGFRSAPPATYAGLTSESESQIANQPTWRQQVRTGDRLSVSAVLRNTSDATITVTGQGKGDPDRDGVWRPDGVQGAPIRIAAGAAVRVTFLGHAQCTPDRQGAVYTFGRTDVAYGGETEDVDLSGRLALSC